MVQESLRISLSILGDSQWFVNFLNNSQINYSGAKLELDMWWYANDQDNDFVCGIEGDGTGQFSVILISP